MYAILVLCLLGFVAAQQPQPCITPKQWEANFFEISEQRGVMVRGRISYDAIYQRERIVEEVDVGKQDDFYEVIALFPSQTEYIYDFKARNCTRRSLTRQWRDFGIPPTAKSFGEAYIGTSALPTAGVLATLWSSNSTEAANRTTNTFGTWTFQACLPVRFVSHNQQVGRTELSFFDVTAGISNPNVFIPRSECLTEEENAAKDTIFAATPKKFQK